MDEKNKMGKQDNCEKTCRRIDVPAGSELKALNAMRAIKDRVREIKRCLSEISSSEKDAGKISELEKKMARLKAEWKEWEKKREEAARERMILLGHEIP